MDYANVVFGAPLWRGSDITVTFACLANSEFGCSSGGRTPTLGDQHVATRRVGWGGVGGLTAAQKRLRRQAGIDTFRRRRDEEGRNADARRGLTSLNAEVEDIYT